MKPRFSDRTLSIVQVLLCIAAVLSLAGLVGVWISGSRERDEWNRFNELKQSAASGDRNAQQQLATCYLTGCGGSPVSATIACGWLLLASKDGDPAVTERAQSTCGSLDRENLGIAQAIAKRYR